MKNSIKKIINDFVSPNLLNVANTDALELDHSLLNISFVPKEETLKENEVEVSVQKMLLGKASINGILVSSVYVPESFTGGIKTKEQINNWLNNKVYSEVIQKQMRIKNIINTPCNTSSKPITATKK